MTFIAILPHNVVLFRFPQVDKDLAYLQEGSKNFDDYVFAVNWAQKFARLNRDIMMNNVLQAARACQDFPAFEVDPTSKAVNCHHNYVNVEKHFGKEVFLTRKGAVSFTFYFAISSWNKFFIIYAVALGRRNHEVRAN